MRQSLRLGLAGAWEFDDPDMVEVLGLLDTQCPTLVKSFLPAGEQVTEDDLDDDGTQNLVVDDEHHFVQLSLKGFQLHGSLYIRPMANLMRLPPQHMFIQHLMAAYRTDYGVRVIDFGPRALRWYKRIAYTDP